MKEQNLIIENLKAILEECTASEDAVSYVNSEDAGTLKAAIEALKKQEKDRWIPVTERLPEVHKAGDDSLCGIYMQSNPVLVYGTAEYGQNAQFHVAVYCDDLDGYTYWSTDPDALTVYGVKAWRPLPEPYTEEEA